MNMPGFTAEVTLYSANRNYRTAKISTSFPNQIVLQDCSFLKDLACSSPMSWCGCGFTGTINCANCLSTIGASWCLECINVNDPREDPNAPSGGSAAGNSGSGFVGGSQQGLTSGSGGAGSRGSGGDGISNPCRAKPWLPVCQ